MIITRSQVRRLVLLVVISGPAGLAARGPLARPASQSVIALRGSCSLIGTPSLDVSLVKIANIDASLGSLDVSVSEMLSRTRC
jgi:hypothetical protein